MADWLDVSDITPRIAYTATAAQTAFVVPFVFFEDEDLLVYQNTTLLTLATHYTVSGAESPTGGTITLLTGATLGDEIMITREVAIVQTTHIPPSGPLDIPAVNIQFSKLIAICQQIANRLFRSIHFADSDSTFSGELGSVSDRKNKLLGFDGNGDLIYPLGPTFVASSTSTGVAVVDSRATAAVTVFGGSVNVVKTQGLSVPGDGGGAEYIRGLVGDPGAFQDGGGVYWKYASIPGAVVEFDSRVTAAAGRYAANVNILVTYGLSAAGDGGGSTYKRGTGSGSFTDASGTSWVPFGSSAAATGIPEGRLTLTAGQPIMSVSATAATSLYYSPFIGKSVPINTGGVVRLYQFTSSATDTTGLGITLGASWTTNTNYDVFIALKSGVVTLCTGPDWSAGAVAGSNTVGSSTRGTGAGSTELQMYLGLMTNKNSITLRDTNGTTFVAAANEATYVGTFRTGSAGQISFTYGAQGTAGTFNLWNCYNQVLVASTSSDSTASWTYTSATVRQSNASAINQFNFIVGLASGSIRAGAVQNVRPTNVVSAFGRMGIALNSTTVMDSRAQATSPTTAGTFDSSLAVDVNYKPQLGANYISMNEASDGTNACTFIGQVAQQLSVSLMM